MEAVKDFKTDHEKHLKAAMDELIASGAEESFVIFETDGGKFVQFSYRPGEGLTFDVPRVGLSEGENQRLLEIDGMDAASESEISYLLSIGVDTRMGARLAHMVFREVFRCPESYRVRATLDR